MKDKERYEAIASASGDLNEAIDSIFEVANLLEVEDFGEFAKDARDIVCHIEDLSHNIFQQNMKSNA